MSHEADDKMHLTLLMVYITTTSGMTHPNTVGVYDSLGAYSEAKRSMKDRYRYFRKVEAVSYRIDLNEEIAEDAEPERELIFEREPE